ncbi:hypothetical protein SZN_09623 [Streptomyces zinciresistens K42]|uniref:Uncharacterized protein n=1 Tax=Streptomyces zinciresistens K42 TaxID=700597 RepID=G2G8V6_9ACTN|nr:hypothetical protein [Streptomyces zinciresistens]EGX60018.1 hypothetical protein SZN_09623 [Streptomyces zinciresistens K42]
MTVVAVVLILTGGDDSPDEKTPGGSGTSGTPGPSLNIPTELPGKPPTSLPSGFPTGLPSGFPTDLPSGFPTDLPSGFPTNLPSGLESLLPSLDGELP